MIIKQITIWIISIVIVVGSLCFPRLAFNEEGYRFSKFGFPIAFVEQVRRGDPPFPSLYLISSPLENPTKLLGWQLLASCGLVVLFLEIIYFIYGARIKKTRRQR